ncbi:MAG TPA: hypothetical protein VHZ02_14450 [Acidimicrobiales bacterium]|jgi:hypothetical protein|nr:hypothetical protein [Acidimicrobiales bacterium]
MADHEASDRGPGDHEAGDHEVFSALVAMAEQDRRWMRRVRRHIRLAGWKKEIIRWSLACGALGPAGPCLATTDAWVLFTDPHPGVPATRPAHPQRVQRSA